MKQNKVPALENSDARFASSDGVIATKPHGHGVYTHTLISAYIHTYTPFIRLCVCACGCTGVHARACGYDSSSSSGNDDIVAVIVNVNASSSGADNSNNNSSSRNNKLIFINKMATAGAATSLPCMIGYTMWQQLMATTPQQFIGIHCTEQHHKESNYTHARQAAVPSTASLARVAMP